MPSKLSLVRLKKTFMYEQFSTLQIKHILTFSY